MKRKPLELRDFIFLGLISVAFGVVYLLAVYIGAAISAALTPFGLGIIGYDFFYGVYYMAPIVALYVLRRPGVGIVAEMLAALIEVLLGNFFGPGVIITGFIQGLGAELTYTVTRYKRFDMKTSMAAAITASVFNFIYTGFSGDYWSLQPWLILTMFTLRTLSAMFFTGFLAHKLCEALERTGLLNAFRPAYD